MTSRTLGGRARGAGAALVARAGEGRGAGRGGRRGARTRRPGWRRSRRTPAADAQMAMMAAPPSGRRADRGGRRRPDRHAPDPRLVLDQRQLDGGRRCPDVQRIFSIQAVRAFLYGFSSILIGASLAASGLDDASVGAVFTAMLLGMAISS